VQHFPSYVLPSLLLIFVMLFNISGLSPRMLQKRRKIKEITYIHVIHGGEYKIHSVQIIWCHIPYVFPSIELVQQRDTHKHICFTLLGTTAKLLKATLSLRLTVPLLDSRKRYGSRRTNFVKFHMRNSYQNLSTEFNFD